MTLQYNTVFNANINDSKMNETINENMKLSIKILFFILYVFITAWYLHRSKAENDLPWDGTLYKSVWQFLKN